MRTCTMLRSSWLKFAVVLSCLLSQIVQVSARDLKVVSSNLDAVPLGNKNQWTFTLEVEFRVLLWEGQSKQNTQICQKGKETRCRTRVSMLMILRFRTLWLSLTMPPSPSTRSVVDFIGIQRSTNPYPIPPRPSTYITMLLHPSIDCLFPVWSEIFDEIFLSYILLSPGVLKICDNFLMEYFF